MPVQFLSTPVRIHLPSSALFLGVAMVLATACSGAAEGGPSSNSGGGPPLVLGTGGNNSTAGFSSEPDAGESSMNPGSSTGGKGSTAGTGTTGGAGGTVTTSSACNNGKDDDGDGLIDGFDPECAGPLDNDEGSFATGIPGDNRDPKWQDCFFDGNSGAGDDRCRYPTSCLTGELESDDPACAVTQSCIDFCGKLVPNGCDCFGCCSVTLPNGESLEIQQSASCSLANIDDTKACPRCSQSTQCANECGECELCPGKTEADLPASCTPTEPPGGGDPPVGDPPPKYTCDGAQVCGPNLPACPSGDYCSLGCCIAQIR